MTTLTKNELLGLTALVVENRDSAKLQKISDIGYIDSINLKAKLLDMISDIEKSEWAEKQRIFTIFLTIIIHKKWLLKIIETMLNIEFIEI